MASMQSRFFDLIGVIKAETKTFRTFISGTNNGDVSGLNTTATNLVSAINEVKATADSASNAAGASINDAAASGSTTFSSNKITVEINAAKQAVKDDLLGGAGPTIDTLQEIAALMSANTTSDAALAVIVGNKANSSDVYTQAQLGDPDTNLVTIWNNA